MFDSRLFWIYFQSNSAPLAPNQSSKNLVKITSALAQPIPAVKTLACPFPGMLLRTMRIPTRSARSIEHFMNSCNKKIFCKSCKNKTEFQIQNFFLNFVIILTPTRSNPSCPTLSAVGKKVAKANILTSWVKT